MNEKNGMQWMRSAPPTPECHTKTSGVFSTAAQLVKHLAVIHGLLEQIDDVLAGICPVKSECSPPEPNTIESRLGLANADAGRAVSRLQDILDRLRG